MSNGYFITGRSYFVVDVANSLLWILQANSISVKITKEYYSLFQIYEDAEKDELELCCREENISLSTT